MTSSIFRKGGVKKVATSTALATLTITGLPFVTASPAMAQACTPVHVVDVPGTGGSSSTMSNDPTNNQMFKEISNRVGAGNVSGWVTNYPASIGALSVFQGFATGQTGGTEMYSYGESVKVGVSNTSKHMSQYKASCPNTKFVLSGYSQGASVAGDVARDISAGKVAGVSPKDIAAVVLFADPNRASQSAFDSYKDDSVLYAPMPEGKMGKNFELIAPAGTVNPTRIGWVGEREGRFTGMYGKVLSLCDPEDMACSTPPNSVLRSLADYANVDSDVNIDSDLGRRISQAARYFRDNGGHQAIQSGDVAKAQRILVDAANSVQIGFQDVPALMALFNEIIGIVDKLDSVCGDITQGEIINAIGQGLVSALPAILINQISVSNVRNLLNMLPPGIIPLEVQVTINTLLPLLDNSLAGPVIDSLLRELAEGLITPITEWVLGQTGLNPADIAQGDISKSLGDQLALAGMFLTGSHQSYWSYNKIGNQTSAAYAWDWAGTAAKNAMNGKTFPASTSGRVLTDPNLEQYIEDTLVDGKPVCGAEELPIPDDPGTTPTDPSDPDNPGTNPTNPDNPGTDPSNPDNPGTDPSNPDNPGTNPSNPSNPGTNPTNPENPGTNPDQPGDTTPTPGTPGQNPGNNDGSGPSQGNAEGLVNEWDIVDLVVQPGGNNTLPAIVSPEEGFNFETVGNTPDWITVDPQTGAITVNAPEGVTGQFTGTIKVTGPDGSVSEISFDVLVENPTSTDTTSGGMLASTGANIGALTALGLGAILLAGAALFARRKA